MTFDEFAQFRDKLLEEVKGMDLTKGREYAHHSDRFANFNRLSAELGCTNVMIGYIYLKKHLDGIASFVAEGRTFSDESIYGRIVDAITYLTLIGGMIKENGKEENIGIDIPKPKRKYTRRKKVSKRLRKEIPIRFTGVRE